MGPRGTVGTRARAAKVAVLGAFAVLGIAPLGSVSAAPTPTPCAAIAAAEPSVGNNPPVAAPALFPADFPVLNDCQWPFRLGGWGGIKANSPRRHVPVIFVHGNQADAENWYLVADQFKKDAGYSDQEMYAISYNGLGNTYAGLPTCCTPAPESVTYWQNEAPAPYYSFCCEGGRGAANDPNVPDLYAFIRAVQAYTGSRQVDIVAHSLGVTITRKMLLLHPTLRNDVLAAVMIAGGNDGTTVCRGLDQSYYGCDEIAPGAPWLTALNRGLSEAPGPTRWMTVFNGTDSSDPFFVYMPGVFDDRQSPALDGAENLTFAQTYHNDLRVRPDIVSLYLKFILDHGQVAPEAVPHVGVSPASPPGLPNTGTAPG